MRRCRGRLALSPPARLGTMRPCPSQLSFTARVWLCVCARPFSPQVLHRVCPHMVPAGCQRAVPRCAGGCARRQHRGCRQGPWRRQGRMTSLSSTWAAAAARPHEKVRALQVRVSARLLKLACGVAGSWLAVAGRGRPLRWACGRATSSRRQAERQALPARSING
jgi:hypothetical protein